MKRSDKRTIAYGRFGSFATTYDLARRGFPEECFRYLFARLPVDFPYVLDVGCGTGISSRQLASYGARVTGCDLDVRMIRVARRREAPNLEYVVGAAERLPFEPEQFDAVTVFSALHWFANRLALDGMRRVLKPGGVLFVANKNDGSFSAEYREVIRPYIRSDFPNPKKDFDPERLLADARFVSVERKHFETDELFTPPHALRYLRSVSAWQLVAPERRHAARRDLLLWCRKMAAQSGGLVRRPCTVTVFAATKPWT